MRYLLATTVLIDGSKLVEPVSFQVRDWLDGLGRVGDVDVADFFSSPSSDPRSRWRPFINELRYWRIGRDVADRMVIDRDILAREGRTFSGPDPRVAALYRVGAPLAINKVEDYPMPGLTVLRPGCSR